MKLLDIINEQSPNDPITDKEIKKIKAVYTALKVGIFRYGSFNTKVRYVLQNHYDIERGPRTGRAVIVLLGDASDVCKLYKVKEDGSTGDYLTIDKYQHIYTDASKKIEDKFKQFNLSIIF